MPVRSMHSVAGLMIGDHAWVWPAVLVGVAGIALTLLLSSRRRAVTGLAVTLRIVGWLLITACLVNPLWSSAQPRSGANLFALLVDDSRSQTVRSPDEGARSDRVNRLLADAEQDESHGWLRRIDEQFELRRYTISDHVQYVGRVDDLAYDGLSSRLESGLTQLAQRFQEQPLAGILLLTDGNATDQDRSTEALSGLAPVYPVILDDDITVPPDLAIRRVTVSQSAFDDAPVTIQVRLQSAGLAEATVRTSLMSSRGELLESHTHPATDETPVSFQVRPKTTGTVFYRVHTELESEEETPVAEATPVNNTQLIAVDRGSRPRRVLYVSGRPNWEFKFLRRAIETDPQTELVGLIRIARKEAKFEFRGRRGERSNALFRGFDASEQETAEEFDEPVLVRLGTKDDEELMSGFPEEAAELFHYDALILDDIEAEFFTADQQQRIREFVSRRGGGLLMLGGQESFRRGEYDRTPIGELLPVDLRQSAATPEGAVRLSLSRDGWLQPWVRLRSEPEAEQTRLQDMPSFRTLNPTLRVRPGAQVMASVSDEAGQAWPALVVQRFGRGRSAALCIGDLWRWRLHEGRGADLPSATTPRPLFTNEVSQDAVPQEDRSDYSRAARQMIRWLVSDVPQRLTVTAVPAPEQGVHFWRLSAAVRDPQYEACENAEVTFRVTDPDGAEQLLRGRAAVDEVGRFDVIVSAGVSGPWNVETTATLKDMEGRPEVLTAQSGWASQPEQREMARIHLNTAWLERVAEQTGGRVIRSSELDTFADDLQTSEAPVMEVVSWPLWHQWSVFLVALGCFVGDWAIRRRLGYP